MSFSREDQFDTVDFSKLDEETDTDSPAVGNGRLSLGESGNVQPHIPLPPPPSSGNRRNTRERGVVIVDTEGWDQPSLRAPSSSNHEEDNLKDVRPNDSSFDDNFNQVSDHQSGSDSSAHVSDIVRNETVSNGESASNSSIPVQICYSKNTGNISVREGQVTTRQDGTRYIETQQIPAQWDENERKPLRKKRIRWIKLFSVISVILFFPAGLFAVYFAFRIDKEFEQGILRGNIDRAQKFATRSERLCILSVIMCILTGALVITLIEQPTFHHSNHYHTGTIAG